jgi:hypothetical protein
MSKRNKLVGVIIILFLCTACIIEEIEDTSIYTVTFDSNGGNGNVPPLIRVQRGADIPQLPSGIGLSKAGHTFGGWSFYPDGTGMTYNAGSPFTPTSNTTLYAKWNVGSVPVNQIVVREEFSTNGTFDFSFSAGFPATVEVYVLGAGGGGQGGHTFFRLFGDNDIGTGGSGGGGSAAYMKFSADKPLDFEITVGRGGNSGDSVEATSPASFVAGGRGERGGSTSVKVDSITLTAQGGMGGGAAGSFPGGEPGRAGSRPAGLLDWTAESGEKGDNGTRVGDLRAVNSGGSAASINIGSEDSFGGGLGATMGVLAEAGGGGRGKHSRSTNVINASRGGHGRVVIVITY